MDISGPHADPHASTRPSIRLWEIAVQNSFVIVAEAAYRRREIERAAATAALVRQAHPEGGWTRSVQLLHLVLSHLRSPPGSDAPTFIRRAMVGVQVAEDHVRGGEPCAKTLEGGHAPVM